MDWRTLRHWDPNLLEAIDFKSLDKNQAVEIESGNRKQ